MLTHSTPHTHPPTPSHLATALCVVGALKFRCNFKAGENPTKNKWWFAPTRHDKKGWAQFHCDATVIDGSALPVNSWMSSIATVSKSVVLSTEKRLTLWVTCGCHWMSLVHRIMVKMDSVCPGCFIDNTFFFYSAFVDAIYLPVVWNKCPHYKASR